MFDFTDNYNTSRIAATEGIVLLKNEGSALPIKKDECISLIGKPCFDFLKGGGGSADVISLYTKSLYDGIVEKESEGKLLFNTDSLQFKDGEFYSSEEINVLAKNSKKAIVSVKIFACEGADRLVSATQKINNALSGELYMSPEEIEVQVKSGCYYPSNEQVEFFDALENSELEDIIVVLNIASVVDLSYLQKYKKIKAIVLCYLAGMEGGRALADILVGDVTPSGKLTDTFALSFDDYPSSAYFNKNPLTSEYKEGIFVGYRYFETYKKERVLYPFGYGLSYTNFDISVPFAVANDNEIKLSVEVTNTGDFCGKEVVQVYSFEPEGKLEKPSLQLRSFKKTKLLSPNEKETLDISIKISDFASFDESTHSWLLEEGEYSVFVGNSVRNTKKCITFSIFEKTYIPIKSECKAQIGEFKTDKTDISLYNVEENRCSLEELIATFSKEELIHLSQGQPPAFARGTAGVGNLTKYNIPNPQTADGPAGLRKSVPTTCFPCGTLLACTWNEDMIFKVGCCIGREGIMTGVDILLAPSMNIHRNVLCGRNFEYFSEDPLVTGKCASAYVRGVQSEGLSATIKHFAANNCEYNRQDNNSIVDERTLREIYLKGFEIAVKEASPDFVMTSYNFLNGEKTSTSKWLLRDILRGEWGYRGAVMTDWRNKSHLWEEIVGGNNIKMPFGYPDEANLLEEKYQSGEVTLEELQENAYWVLSAVLKTNRFKKKFFGITHDVTSNGVSFNGTDVAGISSTRVSESEENGEKFLYNLGLDQREIPTFAYYYLNADAKGEYTISIKCKTDTPNAVIKVECNNTTTIPCNKETKPLEWQIVEGTIFLGEGFNELKITPLNYPEKVHVPLVGRFHGLCEQFAIMNITIKKAEL